METYVEFPAEQKIRLHTEDAGFQMEWVFKKRHQLETFKHNRPGKNFTVKK